MFTWSLCCLNCLATHQPFKLAFRISKVNFLIFCLVELLKAEGGWEKGYILGIPYWFQWVITT